MYVWTAPMGVFGRRIGGVAKRPSRAPSVSHLVPLPLYLIWNDGTTEPGTAIVTNRPLLDQRQNSKPGRKTLLAVRNTSFVIVDMHSEVYISL